jgi:hypothetical protein
MKRSIFATLLLASVSVAWVPAIAQVSVRVGIGLPPPIVFAAPPELVVIPETYVYAVPDVDEDIFFYDGWWWRPWGGRWYRSRSYGAGWGYYGGAPSFYASIPSTWRNDYREHRWYGNQWNYQRLPLRQVQQNWSTWQRNGYWERQQSWGVQGLQPRNQSRAGTPQYQPRGQAQPNPQPQYQGRPQPQLGVAPQYQGRPPAQPQAGIPPQYQGRPQGQPRPQPQAGVPPQYQGRPQGQPRPQPQAVVVPQPSGGQPAPPQAAREGRPQGGRSEKEPGAEHR